MTLKTLRQNTALVYHRTTLKGKTRQAREARHPGGRMNTLWAECCGWHYQAQWFLDDRGHRVECGCDCHGT